MLNARIKEVRTDYGLYQISDHNNIKEPYSLFSNWLAAAIQAKLPDPNAMVLSTVSEVGKPSSRLMLLRHFDENGFVFYTNYESRKGHELDNNNHTALNFFWPNMERQVRVEGDVFKVSEAESDSYFDTRPRENQLSAWASSQSGVIESREQLANFIEDFNLLFLDEPIKRPPHWGGYRVVPHYIEFWQGRPGRLHDRLAFKQMNGTWTSGRLAP